MTYEVAILINGKTMLRGAVKESPAEVGMMISGFMDDLQKRGRVAVIVTHPSGVREIIARSRP